MAGDKFYVGGPDVEGVGQGAEGRCRRPTVDRTLADADHECVGETAADLGPAGAGADPDAHPHWVSMPAAEAQFAVGQAAGS